MTAILVKIAKWPKNTNKSSIVQFKQQIVKIHIIYAIPTNICTNVMENGDIIAETNYQIY